MQQPEQTVLFRPQTEEQIIAQMRLEYERMASRYRANAQGGSSFAGLDIPLGTFFIELTEEMFETQDTSFARLFPVRIHAWMRQLAKRAVGDAKVSWKARAMFMMLNESDNCMEPHAAYLLETEAGGWQDRATVKGPKRLIEFTSDLLELYSADKSVQLASYRKQFNPSVTGSVVWNVISSTYHQKHDYGCPANAAEAIYKTFGALERLIQKCHQHDASVVTLEAAGNLRMFIYPQYHTSETWKVAPNYNKLETDIALYQVWYDAYDLVRSADPAMTLAQLTEHCASIVGRLEKLGYFERVVPSN